MWHCFLLTETADNPVSETTELPPFYKTKKRKKDKKNKKKRERKELYLSEGKYTWLQLHFYRAYLKNSSNVPVFNTDALMTTNCKEKQGKKDKRIKELREVEHQMVKGNS